MTLRDTELEAELERTQDRSPAPPPRRKAKRRPQYTPRFWRCERCERVSVHADTLCEPVPCP